MGDFNINLLRHDKHIPTKHFLETLLAYGFYHLINIPTRLIAESATLIVCNLRPNDVDTCFIFLTHYKSGAAEVLSLFRLQCLKTTDVRQV